MSTDDIVFEDLTYREPRRMRRPDRDLAWTCIAYGAPSPGDLPIFLDRSPADAIERHALRDTSVELGGILLGRECVDDETGEPFVWITKALEAKHFENTQASFTYTHDSWEEITRERDRQYPDLDIVGWYHTHPDFGIFLSGHDLFIHHHFFAQPLQVAYVVDPIRQTRGFFRWRNGEMDQVGGFHISAERTERLPLARLVNDLENIPNTEGSGGSATGLSPRLEAELIAMLTRPHHPVAATGTASQAALFTLLGVALSVTVFGIVFWIGSLIGGLREEAASFRTALLDLQKKSTAARDLEVEAERVHAKEDALDNLLRQVRIGSKPEQFIASYNQVASERDQARRDLEKAIVVREALNESTVNLKRDLVRANEKVADKEKEIDKKQKTIDDDTAQISELQDRLAATNDYDAGKLQKKYLWAWWVAVGASCVSVLLALGLVATVARNAPAEPAAEEPPSHTIT